MKVTNVLVIVVIFASGLFVSCVPESTVKRLDSFVFDTPTSFDIIPVDKPFQSSGSYSSSEDIGIEGIHVWIVLKDDFGNYYLQNPPVTLLSGGKWEVSNIRVANNGVTKMLAVQVSASGHKEFQKLVINEKFEGFLELPEGSEIIASVDINIK